MAPPGNLMMLAFFAGLFIVPSVKSECVSPQISSTSWSTTEGVIAQESAFIAEFSLKCKNSPADLVLFAEVKGKIILVASGGRGQYQVSWTTPHNEAPSETIKINVYDDDGYAAYKKAQRSGGSVEGVKPITTIDFKHPGIYKGPWLSSETIMMLFGIVVFWFAYSTKSDILS